jgi:hypothetical protein
LSKIICPISSWAHREPHLVLSLKSATIVYSFCGISNTFLRKLKSFFLPLEYKKLLISGITKHTVTQLLIREVREKNA